MDGQVEAKLEKIQKMIESLPKDIICDELLPRILEMLPPNRLCRLKDDMKLRLKRDFISELPIELSEKILTFIEIRQLASMCLVCKNWQVLINEESSPLWLRACKRLKISPSDDVKRHWIPILKAAQRFPSRQIKGACHVHHNPLGIDSSNKLFQENCIPFVSYSDAKFRFFPPLLPWDDPSVLCGRLVVLDDLCIPVLYSLLRNPRNPKEVVAPVSYSFQLNNQAFGVATEVLLVGNSNKGDGCEVDGSVPGLLFVGCSTGTVLRYDVDLGKPIRGELEGGARALSCLLSPGEVVFLQHTGPVTTITFFSSETGPVDLLATYGGSAVKIWNAGNGDLLDTARLESHPSSEAEQFLMYAVWDHIVTASAVELAFLKVWETGQVILGALCSGRGETAANGVGKQPFFLMDCTSLAESASDGRAVCMALSRDMQDLGTCCGLVVRDTPLRGSFIFLSESVRAPKVFSVVSVTPGGGRDVKSAKRLQEISVERLVLSPRHMVFDSSLKLMDMFGMENRLLGLGEQFMAVECRLARQSKLLVFEKLTGREVEWVFYTSVGPFEGDVRGAARMVHLQKDWLHGLSRESVTGMMCIVEKSGSQKANAKYVTGITWRTNKGTQSKAEKWPNSATRERESTHRP